MSRASKGSLLFSRRWGAGKISRGLPSPRNMGIRNFPRGFRGFSGTAKIMGVCELLGARGFLGCPRIAHGFMGVCGFLAGGCPRIPRIPSGWRAPAGRFVFGELGCPRMARRFLQPRGAHWRSGNAGHRPGKARRWRWLRMRPAGLRGRDAEDGTGGTGGEEQKRPRGRSGFVPNPGPDTRGRAVQRAVRRG